MYTDLTIDTLNRGLMLLYKPSSITTSSTYFYNNSSLPIRYVKTDNTLDIYVQAPGLKPESIEVHIDGQGIVIKALTRSIPGFSPLSQEIHERISTRNIFTLDPSSAKVEYQDGFLHIYVERIHAERPRVLRIGGSDNVIECRELTESS